MSLGLACTGVPIPCSLLCSPGRWPPPLRSLYHRKGQSLPSLPPGALPPAASSACLTVSTWPLSVPPPVPVLDDPITCPGLWVSPRRSPCRSPSLFRRFSVLPRLESQARCSSLAVALNLPRSPTPDYLPPSPRHPSLFQAAPCVSVSLGLLQLQYPRLDHPSPLWQVTVKSLCDLNAPRLPPRG